MELCRDNNRRYFVVNFDGNCHNYRVSIIKKIPSVKIRRADYIRSLTDKQLAAYLISKPFNSGWSQVEILGWLRGKFGGREDE